jgi:hypothetical protein
MDLGLHTTLTDSTSISNPEILAIAESINPLMAAEFGKVWDLFSTRSAPFATDEYQILTRAYTAPTFAYTASGGDGWDSTSDTTTLAITDVSNISVGDILLVGSEIVVVSVVNSTTSVDVYERGAGDTTGAAHGASGTGKIIGNAHIEGTVDARAMAETTGLLTNYCQIVEEVVDLSKEDSDQARKIGMTAETLKREAMERVMRDLAQSSIYGVSRVGTAAIPAMTRGFISHLVDVAGGIKTAVSGAFTETTLKNILDDVREAGGSVNAIVLSVANKRIANGFTGADSVTTTRDSRTGGQILDGYLADGFGVIPFVVDIDFPDDKVAVANTRFMSKGWKVNDQLRFVPETNVSSRERKETLQGKFGLAMEGVGKTHGILTSLT